MAVTRSQKIRLGIFVGVGLFCLCAGLILLAGMKLGEKRDRYVVRFEDPSYGLNGLEVGAPVKYGGVRVGRVDAIRVSPMDVAVLEVDVSLDGGTPVAEDSVASAASMGITGLRYIELSRGTRGKRIRAPGEEIPAGPSTMDALTESAGAVAERLQKLIENLQGMTDASMQRRVAGVLDNTERLLRTAEETVAENRGSLRQVAAQVASASEQIEGLTRELRTTTARVNVVLDQAGPHAVGLLSESHALARELRQSRATLDSTLQSVNRVSDRGYLVLTQSQEDLDATLMRLKETAENLSAFSERIRDNPAVLIRGGGERGREVNER